MVNNRFRSADYLSRQLPPGGSQGVLTFSMYALVGGDEYVDPAQAPRWGALRCGRILSAPTVQVGRLASFSQPLCPISWRVHPGAFWKPGLRASVAAPMESAQHKRTAARVSPCGSLLLLQASLFQQGRNLRFPAQTHDMHTLAIGLALPDDTGGNLHAGNTGLGFFLIGL